MATLFAFIIGWVFGSFSLYAYLVLTAKDQTYPECRNCTEESCEGCSTLAEVEAQRYNLAA